jgi:hypothetical protein
MPIADKAALQALIDGKGAQLFALLLANSQPRLGTYVALAQAIEDAGHRAVVVYPSPVAPAHEELVGFESVEFSTMALAGLKDLRGVDVFFSSEVICDVAPRDAATVCLPHSLPDSDLSRGGFAQNPAAHIKQIPTMIRTFDYLVATLRQPAVHWDEANYALLQGVYPAAFLTDRRSVLDIVPAGYPKLDYSRQILESDESPKSIIYSPTSLTHYTKGVSGVLRNGEAILSALLEAFTDYTIILRPYPDAANIAHGKKLAEKFSSHPRFRLDCTTTGTASQRDSAVAITDSSSSAITFSLATGRPLVSINLKPDEGLQAGQAMRPKRIPFGFIAESIPAMIEAVESGVGNPSGWKDEINAVSEQSLYNPGTAADYLAAHLSAFAKRESHPDWLSVERRPWVPVGKDGEVEQHLDRLRAWADRAWSPMAVQMYEEIAEYLGAPTPSWRDCGK